MCIWSKQDFASCNLMDGSLSISTSVSRRSRVLSPCQISLIWPPTRSKRVLRRCPIPASHDRTLARLLHSNEPLTEQCRHPLPLSELHSRWTTLTMQRSISEARLWRSGFGCCLFTALTGPASYSIAVQSAAERLEEEEER